MYVLVATEREMREMGETPIADDAQRREWSAKHQAAILANVSPARLRQAQAEAAKEQH